jgi:beta-glucosidase
MGSTSFWAQGACLKRNPLCGRNFEYFSEDPLLSGTIAASWIKGVQGQGIGACLKHYLANNEENFRNMSDSIIDPRALHELYLRNFEIAVKEGEPACVMASYNAVNGVPLSENKTLLQGILRNEWGFAGLVMTDWGGTHSRVKGIEAGVDLDMPGQVKANRNELLEELRKNPAFNQPLDEAVNHVVALGERFKGLVFGGPIHLEKHAQDALKIASEGAVLLKNENQALPR